MSRYSVLRGRIHFMKKMKLRSIILGVGIFSMLQFLPVFAVEQINEDSAIPQADFQTPIIVKAFDRYTGDFYVGTDAQAGDNNRIIARAGRTDSGFTGLSTVVGDAQNARLSGLFALASKDGKAASYVGFNTAVAAATGLSSILASGGAVNATAALGGGNDDEINLTVYGNPAVTISQIAGGYYERPDGWVNGAPSGAYFFVRTRSDVIRDFAVNSGIKAFRMNENGNGFEGVGSGVVNAVASLLYDSTINALGTGSFFRFGSTNVRYAAISSTVSDLYWDSILKTLFVTSVLGIGFAGAAQLADLGHVSAISKVTFKNDVNAKLIISDIIDSTYFPLLQDTTAIFASHRVHGDVDYTNSPKIHKLRTMHMSTGKIYLIVNGMVGDVIVQTNGASFYALRYNENAAETLVGAGTGQIVQNDKDGTDLGNDFILSGGIHNALDGGNVGSLLIGGGVAPWQGAGAQNLALPASDMEVVGDTVYVSYAAVDRDTTNDPGVWASTAMFDKDGVVIGWTSWERVMASQDPLQDKISFFAVDASNNKIWTVGEDGQNATVTRVVRHGWKTSDFDADSLPEVVNTSFGAGIYSDVTCVLDIPKNTPGITYFQASNTDLTSLVMFGGYEKVDFAKTSKSFGLGVGQVPTLDFSVGVNPNHYVETTLTGAGTVRCLGVSRSTIQSEGYFLAGTDTGLWIWALDAGNHAGYDANAVVNATLAAPLDTALASWHKFDVTQISGPVIAIDSDGVYIYLIEQDITSDAGIIISKLWRIAIGDDIPTMEVAGQAVIIAQSGKDEIPANAIFTDFKFITDGTALRATHATQCILSTNIGAFYPTQALSSFANVAVAGATPNAPQGWESKEADKFIGKLFAPKRVPATAQLAGTNDGINHRVVANTLVDDSRGFGYFQNTALSSLNASSDLTNIGSARYTNLSMAAGTATLTYLNNRALAFWSDGGRRFYTRRNVSESWGNADFNMLNSLPYNATEWNMSEPFGDDATNGQTIYWVESISGLGIILAGTTNGVIALQ